MSNEKLEIIFMQTRLIRLASTEWHMPIKEVVDLFIKWDIFKYIEDGYGIFHCEGDKAVLEDINVLIERKKKNVGIE